MNSETHFLLLQLMRSVSMGFGLFALGALVQGFVVKDGVQGVSVYADDLILGLLAGLLMFAYEQKRHSAIVKRIQVIAAMNHHVRNALQAITLSRYAEHTEQIQLIDESAKRIQWALRELLPRTQEDGNTLSVGAFRRTADVTPHSTLAPLEYGTTEVVQGVPAGAPVTELFCPNCHRPLDLGRALSENWRMSSEA
jgi:hypothetical protein